MTREDQIHLEAAAAGAVRVISQVRPTLAPTTRWLTTEESPDPAIGVFVDGRRWWRGSRPADSTLSYEAAWEPNVPHDVREADLKYVDE